MAPRVVVLMLGQLTDLHAWGRDRRQHWWALVSWTVYGNTTDGNAYRHISAWVPAAALRPSADPSQLVLYRAVERLDLNGDPSTWPTPARTQGRVWTHHGAIVRAPPAPADIATMNRPRFSDWYEATGEWLLCQHRGSIRTSCGSGRSAWSPRAVGRTVACR